MATNKEKYQTICTRVGLARGSWALDRFVQDAVDHHMDDQPGKLVALRLTEYYELLDRLNILPGGLALISPVTVTTETSLHDAPPVRSSRARPSESVEQETPSGTRGKQVEEEDASHQAPETQREDEEDSQWGDL